MPRKLEFHQPDQIDCNTIQTAIGTDFGLQCTITTTYERDTVLVICKAHKPGDYSDGMVQVQALVRSPLRTAKSLYTMQYSAMLDCWHQLDRGLLAVAKTPIEFGWDGRPRTPGR